MWGNGPTTMDVRINQRGQGCWTLHRPIKMQAQLAQRGEVWAESSRGNNLVHGWQSLMLIAHDNPFLGACQGRGTEACRDGQASCVHQVLHARAKRTTRGQGILFSTPEELAQGGAPYRPDDLRVGFGLR